MRKTEAPYTLFAYLAEKINLVFKLSSIETGLLMVVILYLPVTILLSSLTFSTIEKPFLNMRVTYLRKKDNYKNESKKFETPASNLDLAVPSLNSSSVLEKHGLEL